MLPLKSMATGHSGIDFDTFATVAQVTMAGGSPYSVADGFFRWSPLMAYAWAPVAALGIVGWRLVHIAVLPLLGDRRLIFFVAISYPFWFDVDLGNLVTFAFVFAVMALRGSRIGTAAFFAVALLVPRPVMVPVSVWLLWHRPETRLPVAVAAVVSVLGAAATGYLPQWLGVLTSSTGDMTHELNYAPSRIIGSWWIVVGLPLAAVLTWKGRLGWASLAAAPYWLPYYLLFGLLELVPLDGRVSSQRHEDQVRRQDAIPGVGVVVRAIRRVGLDQEGGHP